MSTVTIQIGNSDNKLTQEEWADFVALAALAPSSIGSDKKNSEASP